MIRIYVKQGCPHCEAINIPEGVNAVKVDINDGYEGFVPAQVPIIQINGINLAGPPQINGFLHAIKQTQDGEYDI